MTNNTTDLAETATTNFLLAEEYRDFIEFIEDELGVDEAKELMNKFLASQEVR